LFSRVIYISIFSSSTIRITQRDNVLFNSFSKSMALYALQQGTLLKDFTGAIPGVYAKLYSATATDVKILAVHNSSTRDFKAKAKLIPPFKHVTSEMITEVVLRPNDVEILILAYNPGIEVKEMNFLLVGEEIDKSR
jgi:hypothetical protein